SECLTPRNAYSYAPHRRLARRITARSLSIPLSGTAAASETAAQRERSFMRRAKSRSNVNGHSYDTRVGARLTRVRAVFVLDNITPPVAFPLPARVTPPKTPPPRCFLRKIYTSLPSRSSAAVQQQLAAAALFSAQQRRRRVRHCALSVSIDNSNQRTWRLDR